jgi:DNA repair exonuclease SbcCD ATPase subunit
MEIHEIEERKHRHINDLMDNFEKAFTEMRNYYNSITRDNLALIKSLNDEIEVHTSIQNRLHFLRFSSPHFCLRILRSSTHKTRRAWRRSNGRMRRYALLISQFCVVTTLHSSPDLLSLPQLTLPLEQTEAEVKELQKSLMNYEKDKISLRHAQARLLQGEQEFKRLSDEQKSLKDKYAALEAERSEHTRHSWLQRHPTCRSMIMRCDVTNMFTGFVGV